jgi:hypothetical protein
MISSLLALEKPEQLILTGLKDYIIEHWESKYEGYYALAKETSTKFFDQEKFNAMFTKENSQNKKNIAELINMSATKAEVTLEVSRLAKLHDF